MLIDYEDIRAENYKKSQLCMFCKTSTTSINEHYIVHEAVWLQASPSTEGFLCIECLEKRINRKLTPKDFTDCPMNRDIYSCKKSDRLLNRMGKTMTFEEKEYLKKRKRILTEQLSQNNYGNKRDWIRWANNIFKAKSPWTSIFENDSEKIKTKLKTAIFLASIKDLEEINTINQYYKHEHRLQ